MIKLKTPEPLVSAVFIKKYFPQAPLKEHCNCQIIGKVTDDEKIVVNAFEGSRIEY